MRTIISGVDKYTFSQCEDGMLITKNDEELGMYPSFEYGDNLDGDYLIELANEFEG